VRIQHVCDLWRSKQTDRRVQRAHIHSRAEVEKRKWPIEAALLEAVLLGIKLMVTKHTHSPSQ
jgi:hypothetical protein